MHLSFNNPNDLVTRLKDYSSYGNDGVFMGGTKYDYRSDEGYDGRGAYFMDHSVPDNNKTALQLLTPEFANGLSNDFTISMLIKPGTGGSGNAVFFSRSCSTHWCLRIDQEEFGYTPNGQAVDFFSDRTLSNRLPNVKNIVGVDFRRWYHLVGVWNTGDGTARYYINGQETNITGYDANFSSVDRAVAFGADVGATVPNVNQETYKGWVDDLIILNSSLSASDVSDMFRYYDEHTPCAFETDYPLVECP